MVWSVRAHLADRRAVAAQERPTDSGMHELSDAETDGSRP